MDSAGKESKEFNNKMNSTPHSNGKDACVYYGINIPVNLIGDEDFEKVFTDKNICLLLLKQFPGSRFKCFKTFEEAVAFSNFRCATPPLDHETQNKISDLISSEKSSPFRGPKSQDLVKFRKSIETGNIDYFNKCVNENPRYLVSSGDTPAILQEGSRYNALHIACKFDRTEFCNKILSTISVADFFQRLYPDDPLSSSERRSAFLLDLYLNTPDKGLNETPLHFACKFGSFNCIKLLTSYSTCDKLRPNKYNETPNEIICTRAKMKDEKLIEKIKELFEEQCYVPVLRDEDSCLSPLIAPPWSVVGIKNSPPTPALPLPPDDRNSPAGPTRKVSGYAGPMSPQKANSFYSRWKRSSVPSPLRGMKGKLAALRIKDLEKGVERVGRNLAAEFDVDWVEYWSFLGNFTNLSSSEGLQSLENHLKLQFKAVMDHTSTEVDEDIKNLVMNNSQYSECEISQLLPSEGVKYLDETDSSLSSIGGLCEDLEALRLNVSLSPREKSKTNVKVKTCSTLKRKLSNSVSIPSSKKPVVFHKKENEELRNEINLNCGNSTCNLNISEYSVNKLEDSFLEDDYYSFAIQSTRISAHRIACILVEVSRTISYHIGPDFQIARILRNKMKPELQSLRKILSKWECVLPEKKIDLGFVHIFLSATTIEQVMENVSTSNLYLISESLKLLILNMHSLNDSSSDENENVESSPKELEYSEFHAHFACVVNKLDTAILLGIELLKEGREENKINLSKFDDCYCNWNDQYFKVEKPSSIRYQPVDTKQINESINNQSSKKKKSSSQFVKAHSLLSRFLFGKSFEEETENKNISVITPVFNTNSNIPSIDTSKSEENIEEDNKESEDNESFASAVSSFDSEESLVTPEQEIKFFINGTEPTKDDFDVFVALESSDIDEKMFPFVFRWKNLIESYTFQEKGQWPSTTRKKRFKPFVGSSPKQIESGAKKQLIL